MQSAKDSRSSLQEWAGRRSSLWQWKSRIWVRLGLERRQAAVPSRCRSLRAASAGAAGNAQRGDELLPAVIWHRARHRNSHRVCHHSFLPGSICCRTSSSQQIAQPGESGGREGAAPQRCLAGPADALAHGSSPAPSSFGNDGCRSPAWLQLQLR